MEEEEKVWRWRRKEWRKWKRKRLIVLKEDGEVIIKEEGGEEERIWEGNEELGLQFKGKKRRKKGKDVKEEDEG